MSAPGTNRWRSFRTKARVGTTLADPGVAASPQQDLAEHAAAHSRSKRSTGRTNTVAPPTSTSRG